MTGRRESTLPVKDDIAVQHRPDNAQSRNSALGPTGRDSATAPHARSGPVPDGRELAAARGRGPTASDPLVGEALPPEHPKIKQIERVADWLDTRWRLPIVGVPVGLDGLIGLIPGVGDTVTTGLSAWLVYEAHRAGARKRTIGKMAVNVGLDWLLGLIPLVGDLIDFGYKANARNARLLVAELRRLDAERGARRPPAD